MCGISQIMALNSTLEDIDQDLLVFFQKHKQHQIEGLTSVICAENVLFGMSLLLFQCSGWLHAWHIRFLMSGSNLMLTPLCFWLLLLTAVL